MPSNDLIYFARERWSGVQRRPHHLFGRWAREGSVFYVEPPSLGPTPGLMAFERPLDGVTVVTPRLPEGITPSARTSLMRVLVQELVRAQEIHDYVVWYAGPEALASTRQLSPTLTVYDCEDDLGARATTSEVDVDLERELFGRGHLVFTRGPTLQHAKRPWHGRVSCLPPGVDREHFRAARALGDDGPVEPVDQAVIPGPRVGYYGTIDRRLDLGLVDALAGARPEWHFVFVGPTAGLTEADLPRRPNLHWLGARPYTSLPSYLGGWDVAIVPYVMDEATRFANPAQLLEYLAAGRRVVSSPLPDVVRTLGEAGLVSTAWSQDSWLAAIARAMTDADRPSWLGAVDGYLVGRTWCETYATLCAIMRARLAPPGAMRLPRRGQRVGGRRTSLGLEVVVAAAL